jgi:hypothetical protein
MVMKESIGLSPRNPPFPPAWGPSEISLKETQNSVEYDVGPECAFPQSLVGPGYVRFRPPSVAVPPPRTIPNRAQGNHSA